MKGLRVDEGGSIEAYGYRDFDLAWGCDQRVFAEFEYIESVLMIRRSETRHLYIKFNVNDSVKELIGKATDSLLRNKEQVYMRMR